MLPALTFTIHRSEQRSVSHEFRKIPVDDSVATLYRIIACKYVFRIVVANLLQWCVFAILRFFAGHHCHGGLHIGVCGIAVSKYEVAFKLADPTYACRIAVRTGVCVDDILQGRAIVDSVVGVGRKVESEVGEIILLFATD